jgi:hypothetical protein
MSTGRALALSETRDVALSTSTSSQQRSDNSAVATALSCFYLAVPLENAVLAAGPHDTRAGDGSAADAASLLASTNGSGVAVKGAALLMIARMYVSTRDWKPAKGVIFKMMENQEPGDGKVCECSHELA